MKVFLELFRVWRDFLSGENRFFWEDLTETMEAQEWRSPWGILRAANLAHDYGSEYEGWTIAEIYALFCDEQRYIEYLKS